MSFKMQALVEEITFGDVAAKAIAMKLANWSDDDGGSIFPAVLTIAAKTETSKRRVQQCLADWRDMRLLFVVRQGGGGPRRTTEYRFNMKLVHLLITGRKKIVQKSVKKTRRMFLEDVEQDANNPAEESTPDTSDNGEQGENTRKHPETPGTENKGAGAAPRNNAKGAGAARVRVQELHHKGAGAAPNPSIPINLTQDAHTREGECLEIFPLKELLEEGYSARVVNGFIRPLINANLILDAGHNIEFFRALCEHVYIYGDATFTSAAKKLVSIRRKFPRIADCLEVLKEFAANSGIIVSATKDPEEWQAWLDHYKNAGQRWQAARMDSLEISTITVATKKPPTLKDAVQETL